MRNHFGSFALATLVVILFCSMTFAQDQPMSLDAGSKTKSFKVDASKAVSSNSAVGNLKKNTRSGLAMVLPKSAWNAICPVGGDEVDSKCPTETYNGKVYGFCCAGCDTKFKKDPEKYIGNLNEDGTKFVKK